MTQLSIIYFHSLCFALLCSFLSCAAQCNLLVTRNNDRKQEGRSLVMWGLWERVGKGGKGGKGMGRVCRTLCKCHPPWISHSVTKLRGFPLDMTTERDETSVRGSLTGRAGGLKADDTKSSEHCQWLTSLHNYLNTGGPSFKSWQSLTSISCTTPFKEPCFTKCIRVGKKDWLSKQVSDGTLTIK